MCGEGSGIDALDRHDVRGLQIFLKRSLAAPVARQAAGLLDDESFRPDPGGLDVFRCHAVVADVRTGHGHDLSPVGGIGQHFLIAGHGRVEHDFASGLPFCSEGPSFEPGAVGERKNRFLQDDSLSRDPGSYAHGQQRDSESDIYDIQGPYRFVQLKECFERRFPRFLSFGGKGLCLQGRRLGM